MTNCRVARPGRSGNFCCRARASWSGQRGSFAAAIDAMQQLNDFAYRAVFHQGADSLSISGTAAGKVYSGDDVAFELDVD
ncbi:MAG: hypothetical protein R2864_00870 [Syntrophotaleaceae bacterium]